MLLSRFAANVFWNVFLDQRFKYCFFPSSHIRSRLSLYSDIYPPPTTATWPATAPQSLSRSHRRGQTTSATTLNLRSLFRCQNHLFHALSTASASPPPLPDIPINIDAWASPSLRSPITNATTAPICPGINFYRFAKLSACAVPQICCWTCWRRRRRRTMGQKSKFSVISQTVLLIMPDDYWLLTEDFIRLITELDYIFGVELFHVKCHLLRLGPSIKAK